MIKARRLGIVDKKEKSCVAVPTNGRVYEKEREKVLKYQDFRSEIGSLWQFRNVPFVPVVIGACPGK